jgi:phosphopantothenoylcysteine decarboxylase/phosphopantothenate--cysteine ligase
MIVMNTMKDIGAGFGVDTNKISILDNCNNFETFELKSKSEVAKDILMYLKNYNS